MLFGNWKRTISHSVMSIILIQRRLHNLQYPYLETFDPYDSYHLSSFIRWIEDVHIRIYDPKDRACLDLPSNHEYTQVLNKYLEDLQCPYQGLQSLNERKNLLKIVTWLLGYAISEEYIHRNDPEEIQASNSQDKFAAHTASHAIMKEYPQNAEVCLHVLRRIAQFLKLPHYVPLPRETQLETMTVMIRNIVQRYRSIKTMLKAMENQNASVIASLVSANIEQHLQVPGAESQDRSPNEGIHVKCDSMDIASEPKIDAIEQGLHKLYVAHLKQLQLCINRYLSQMQRHTANPATNLKQEKLGR